MSILLFFVSSFTCLGISELVLQKFFHIKPGPYEIDNYVLYKLRPNSEKTFVQHPENGGEKIRIKVNSLGFRGPELRDDRSSKRIVVYGDSFIEAEFSHLEDTFVVKLQEKLRLECPFPIETINAGVIGYGPDQISRKIEREIDILLPDLIIVAIFADNDFGDLIRNKIYRLGPDGRLQENRYSFSKRVLDGLESPEELVLVRMMKKAYWRLLAIRRKYRANGKNRKGKTAGDPKWTVEGWLEESKKEYVEFVLKADNEIKQIRSDHIDADICLEPKSESAIYKAKLMEKVLLRMKQIVESRNIPLILLIIPSPVDVVEDYDITVNEELYPDYNPRNLSNRVVECAENAGIPHLNLFDGFSKNNPSSLYFRHGDNHWNANGQELAAELTEKFILENGILGCM